MAYKRRYLSGQLAVTVDIAQRAVTTDKIAAGAVGGTQLKDDSVSTGKIIDGQVKALDLGLHAVETAKIKDQAVTTPKLADASITKEKLDAEVALSVRPLDPGVATVEIADSAVTPAKIGAEAVETAKIKDGAVTADKIAAGAVTTGKIATDSVGSDQIVASAIKTAELDNLSVSEGKIIDGSVSVNKLAANAVTEVKIANDAVTEDKIEDDAVTEPKLDAAALAFRHIESKDRREMTHFEEFAGVDISPRWRKTGAAGGLVTIDGLRGVHVLTGAVNGNGMRIDYGGQRIGAPLEVQSKLNVWITTQHADLNYVTLIMALWNDVNNCIGFYAHDAGGATPNWFAHSLYLGVGDQIDTGIPISTDIQVLKIDVIAKNLAKFYINDVLVATTTKDHAAADQMEPYFSVTTRKADVRWFKMKYFSLMANRPAYV